MDPAGGLTLLTAGVEGLPEPAELVAVGDLVVRVIVAISYLSVTLFVGAMLVSNAGERTRAVGEEIRQHPVESGGFGVGTVVACVAGYLLVGVTAAGLAELGAPAQVGILVLIPLVVGVIGLVTATALGQLVVGIILLRRFSEDGRPNLWGALIVGTVVVGMAAILPVGNLVGVAVTVLAIGGVTRRLWRANTDRLSTLRDRLLE
jgi:hypothetical protein